MTIQSKANDPVPGSEVDPKADPNDPAGSSPEENGDGSEGSGDEGSSTAGDGEGESAGGSQAEGTEGKTPSPEAKPKADWRDKRLNRVVAQKRELELKVAELERKANSGTELSAEDQQKLVQQEIKRGVERQLQIDRAKATHAEGIRQFGQDFDKDVLAISNVIDSSDRADVEKYMNFLTIAMDTGEAPKLYHELAQDLDRVVELMDLPPAKLAIELTKLATKAGPDPVSSAPKPIRGIAPKGTGHTAIAAGDKDRADNLDTKSWMERRQREVDEYNKRTQFVRRGAR